MFRLSSLSVWIAVLVILSAAACWIWMPNDYLVRLCQEGEPVRVLTEWLYLATIVIVLIFAWPYIRWNTILALVIVLAAMYAYETGMYKTVAGFPGTLEIPFSEISEIVRGDILKVIAILLVIFLSVLYFLVKYTKTVLRHVYERIPYAITIIVFLVVLTLSETCDRILNGLAGVSLQFFPDWVAVLQISQEEFLERLPALQIAQENFLGCLVPLLILTAFIQYRTWMPEPEDEIG